MADVKDWFELLVYISDILSLLSSIFMQDLQHWRGKLDTEVNSYNEVGPFIIHLRYIFRRLMKYSPKRIE